MLPPSETVSLGLLPPLSIKNCSHPDENILVPFPPHQLFNHTAAIISAIYCLLTSAIAVRTALYPSPGFGALKHTLTFLATAPVSIPLSILDMEPNFNRPTTSILVILEATAVVCAFVTLIVWIAAKL